MQVNVFKLHADAILPERAHNGDAGMDLFALETVEIAPGGVASIRTGIALGAPEGTVALIWDKSGMAVNKGIKVMGGVVDAGYSGEIKVGLYNTKQNKDPFIVEKGTKIAQILIQPILTPEVVEVETQNDVTQIKSDRGEGGFGSTGAKAKGA